MSLEILNQIPVGYLYLAAGLALFFLIYILSKIFVLEEGIFPKFVRFCNVAMRWTAAEISGVYHFLFGTITEAVDEFFVNQKGFRLTGRWSIFLWSFITVLSLLTSYRATREWALWVGISDSIAWAFPAIIDLVIIAAILQTAFYAFSGEDNFGVKTIVAIYTLASIFINVTHLAFNQEIGFYVLVGGVAAPAGIWACSEQIYKTIRKMSYREGIYITDLDLRNLIKERKAELKALDTKVEEVRKYETKIQELKNDQDHMRKVLAKLDKQFVNGVPRAEDRLEKTAALLDQGLTTKEVAQELNIAEKSARSYVRSVQNGVS